MLAPNDPHRRRRAEAVSPMWAVVVRSFAFLRKEVVEILRQPRLIVLLVLGPFALLVLFGAGYADYQIIKRAVFVGPEGSVYEQVIQDHEEQLDDFIEVVGMVPTVDEGRAALDRDEADVVVIFPDDPAASLMNGERAVVQVLHDEIDPIQQGAIEIAARLAIQETNAAVLASVAGGAGDLLSTAELGDALLAGGDRLQDDPEGAAADLRTSTGLLSDALEGTSTVLDRLDTDARTEEMAAQVESVRRSTAEIDARLRAVDASTSDAELEQLANDIGGLAGELDDTSVLDPDVLVRPFDSDTENILPGTITPTGYFTPASLALLLQHLALTFAALSIVRDRRTGLFELMRVGPLSSIEIVVGKIFAYLLVGTVVAAALVGAATFALDVSLTGAIGWLALIVIGVLLASLALGMVLATISKSESQAVQFAMLALLAGLFFSGFILPIDALQWPFRAVSYVLPVTYGVSALQQIMLEGRAPDDEFVVGLSILVVVYGTMAIVGLRRQLSTASD